MLPKMRRKLRGMTNSLLVTCNMKGKVTLHLKTILGVSQTDLCLLFPNKLLFQLLTSDFLVISALMKQYPKICKADWFILYQSFANNSVFPSSGISFL